MISHDLAWPETHGYTSCDPVDPALERWSAGEEAGGEEHREGEHCRGDAHSDHAREGSVDEACDRVATRESLHVTTRQGGEREFVLGLGR